MAATSYYHLRKGGYFSPQSSICSVFFNGNCSGSIVKMEYFQGCRIFIILPHHVLPSDQKSEVIGLKLGFENKTPVNLKPDWVKMVWPFPECNSGCKEGQLDVTVVELSLNAIEMLSPANFKDFSADSTIVGSKKGININNILDAFQAKFSKLEKHEQIKLESKSRLSKADSIGFNFRYVL